MEGVIRLVHRGDLDLCDFIDPHIRKNLPRMDKIMHALDDIVLRVQPEESDEWVHLDIFFTNLYCNYMHAGSPRRFHYSVGVFPGNSQKVIYEIKKGNFFVNQSSDPIIVYESDGIGDVHASIDRSFLLFKRNPFENLYDYKHIKLYLGKNKGYEFMKMK